MCSMAQWHEEFLNGKCAEIEKLLNLNSKVAHTKIKEMSNKKTYNTPPGCLKDKNGEMFFEEEDIKERWKEYIAELYDNPYRGSQPHNFEEHLTGPTILKSEPRHAVLSMRNGQAVGPDQISAEVIKALDEVEIDVLYEMLN